tara:strand:- start:327 stop:524 length:198 start_codon:yes stop_codon:yes gene_type:complete
MKILLKKLLKYFEPEIINIPSIKELKILKKKEKKVALSKQFRVYVMDLNKKQQNWLKSISTEIKM